MSDYLAVAVLWAEVRMGELLEQIPKKGKTKEYSSDGGTIPTLPSGITKKQSFYAQQLFRNEKIKGGSNQATTLPSLCKRYKLLHRSNSLEKNYGSIHVCQYVAEQYKVVNRFTTLGFRHHQIAAAEEDRLE